MRHPADLSLLIVEDHTLTAKYLSSRIGWKSIGVSVMGCACNGEEAMEIVKAAVPDIILTDIRMPRMDGLALLRALRERNLPTKAVIISAFNEFAYAQEAIRLGAVDYILKPIEDGAVLEVVARARDMCIRERSVDAGRPADDGSAGEPRRPPFGELMDLVLEGARATPESVQAAASRRRVELPADAFRVCVAQCDPIPPGGACAAREPEGPRQALVAAFRCLADHGFVVCHSHQEARTVFLLCRGRRATVQAEEPDAELLAEAQRRFRQAASRTFSAGVSSVGRCIRDIPACAREADEAFRRLFFMAPGSVCLRTGDGATGARKEFAYPVQHEEKAVTFASMGLFDDALRELSDFIDAFQTADDRQPSWIKEAVATLSIRLLNEVLQKAGNEGAGSLIGLYREMMALSSLCCLEAVKSSTLALLRRAMPRNGEPPGEGSSLIVRKALSFISLYYAEAFSVEDVARFVGYSPNYFSHAFKTHQGKSFSRVLNEYRIEKAKRLLEEPDIRINEVAERVGFDDPQYFSHQFNELTGASPTEYRKSIHGSRRDG